MAEPKFKVGDQVRALPLHQRTGNGYVKDEFYGYSKQHPLLPEGTVFTVTGNHSSIHYKNRYVLGYKDKYDVEWGIWEGNIELVGSPKSAEKCESTTTGQGIFIPEEMLPRVVARLDEKTGNLYPKLPSRADQCLGRTPAEKVEFYMQEALDKLALARFWNERIEDV